MYQGERGLGARPDGRAIKAISESDINSGSKITTARPAVACTFIESDATSRKQPGQQQPGPPIAFRGLLIGPPPPAPIVLDRFELAVTRPFQERRQLFWRQRCEQFGG